MNCDKCGEYIEEFAVCPDCVTELEQQIKRTPVELAAGELLDMCEKSLEYFVQRDAQHNTISGIALKLINVIGRVKTPNNPSPQSNPPAQDEHKSVL